MILIVLKMHGIIHLSVTLPLDPKKVNKNKTYHIISMKMQKVKELCVCMIPHAD